MDNVDSRKKNKPCPHCGHSMGTKGNRFLSPYLTERRYGCDNCGVIIVYGETPLRTISESNVPNPDFDVPLCQRVQKQRQKMALVKK